MFKRWKGLSDLDCVKERGIRHKLAHFFGTYMLSECFMSLGKHTYKE